MRKNYDSKIEGIRSFFHLACRNIPPIMKTIWLPQENNFYIKKIDSFLLFAIL